MANAWIAIELAPDAPGRAACDLCGLPDDVLAVQIASPVDQSYLCLIECERCGSREVAGPVAHKPD